MNIEKGVSNSLREQDSNFYLDLDDIDLLLV